LSASIVVEFNFVCCFAGEKAILGFTGLINQVQYHAALTDKNIPSMGGGWNGMTKAGRYL
jgi:hypothetical protein